MRPWEADDSSSASLAPNNRDPSVRLLQISNGFSAWDISQRHIPTPKGNVTEIVARYRETAVDVNINDHFRYVAYPSPPNFAVK